MLPLLVCSSAEGGKGSTTTKGLPGLTALGVEILEGLGAGPRGGLGLGVGGTSAGYNTTESTLQSSPVLQGN